MIPIRFIDHSVSLQRLTKLTLIFFPFIGLFILNSCSIEKRRYRSGFYITKHSLKIKSESAAILHAKTLYLPEPGKTENDFFTDDTSYTKEKIIHENIYYNADTIIVPDPVYDTELKNIVQKDTFKKNKKKESEPIDDVHKEYIEGMKELETWKFLSIIALVFFLPVGIAGLIICSQRKSELMRLLPVEEQREIRKQTKQNTALTLGIISLVFLGLFFGFYLHSLTLSAAYSILEYVLLYGIVFLAPVAVCSLVSGFYLKKYEDIKCKMTGYFAQWSGLIALLTLFIVILIAV